MSTESDALLAAFRTAALAKRATRAEMKANRINGFNDIPMDQLDTWDALDRAGKAATQAMIAWEKSEGIHDD